LTLGELPAGEGLMSSGIRDPRDARLFAGL
jgi:hypothetical protein